MPRAEFLENPAVESRRALLKPLLQSNDTDLRALGEAFKTVYWHDRTSPPLDVLSRWDTLAKEICEVFPSRFASEFHALNNKHGEVLLNQQLQPEYLRTTLSEAFGHINSLWKTLLDSLPLIFVLSLNRIRRETLIREAPNELKATIDLYEQLFHRHDGRIAEGDQVRLLRTLLHTHRKLDRAGALLDNDFVFQAVATACDGFSQVIPETFDRCMELLGRVRNRLAHDRFFQQPIETLDVVYTLCSWAFLHIVETLLPISRRYYFVIIEGIDDRIIRGRALVGLVESTQVMFGRSASRTAEPQPGRLYLVDRTRQLTPSKSEPLGPPDFMDLTPLLHYTDFDAGQPRTLFVLRAYEDAAQSFLRYHEYAGTRSPSLSPTEPRHVRYFNAYQEFHRNFVQRGGWNRTQTVSRAPHSDGRQKLIDAVVSVAHEVSRDHLSAVLDLGQYDEQVALRPDAQSRSVSARYDERLFVRPAETRAITEFEASERRGLVFIGDSGSGKSNILCSAYLDLRRRGISVVFLDARRLLHGDLPRVLRETLLDPAGVTAAELTAATADSDRYFYVLVDAVNEYNNAGGPLTLLRSVISLIESADRARLKLVVSCRSETWQRYKEEHAHAAALNPNASELRNGDVVVVSGFDDEARRDLYERYQEVYQLEPRRLEDAGEAVANLIRQPFMMRVIAETYSNIDSDPENPVVIPRRVDYFRLFNALTGRKIADAKRLLPVGDLRAAAFPAAVVECLTLMAALVYQRLTDNQAGHDTKTSHDRSDALTMQALRADPRLHQHLEPFVDGGRSVFETLVQVGIVDTTRVVEKDYWGTRREVDAYKFFHDQYTQYCLAGFYNAQVLSWVDEETLGGGANLESLIDRLDAILQASARASVLAGGLEQWFFIQMRRGARDIGDPPIAVFNAWISRLSGASGFFVGQFLHSLIERRVLPRDAWFRRVFARANPDLRRALAEYAVSTWPDLDPEHFTQLIDSCDPSTDDGLIVALADLVAYRFGEDPTAASEYLAKTVMQLDQRRSVLKALAFRGRLVRHMSFVLKFAVKVVLLHFRNPAILEALRAFLLQHFGSALSLVLERSPGFTGSIAQRYTARLLERSGINQWDQAIGPHDNNRFFVESDGLVQRDALYEYFQYAIALHNADDSQLYLGEASEFRRRSIDLMNYRSGSVAGYTAAIVTAGATRGSVEQTAAIVEELLARQTVSGRYYANVFATQVALANPRCARDVLLLYENRMIPNEWQRPELNASFLLGWLAVAESTVDETWDVSERITTQTIEFLSRRGDMRLVEEFGTSLAVVWFHADKRLAEKITHLLLDRDFSRDAVWNTVTLRVLAGLLARSPAALGHWLARYELSDIEPDVRRTLTPDLLRLRGEVSYQASWNEFLVAGLTQIVKLRYFLVKILYGGLIQSNSVDEYACEFRRFVLETARAFVYPVGGAQQYDHLTIEEALEVTESQRIPGGGQPWMGTVNSHPDLA